jgi:dolichol-phosphate mannosyltransferase
VPISYQPRKEKKLQPWKDGWPALAMLLRRRFKKPFHSVEAAQVNEVQPQKMHV